jgi:hypothetical protein
LGWFASAPGVKAQVAQRSETNAPRKVVVSGAEAYAIGFEMLSAFPYIIVDAGTGASPEEMKLATARDQVPSWLRVYQAKRIILTGYMLPIQLENGLAKKFFVMRDVTTCCYGKTPNMNDYVVVTMKGNGANIVQDIPVTVVGILNIGEKYEFGYLVSLFEMEGEKFLGRKK